MNEIPFDHVSFPTYCNSSFEKLFKNSNNFEYDLANDCSEAFRFLGSEFDFTCEEFYRLIKSYLIEKEYNRF